MQSDIEFMQYIDTLGIPYKEKGTDIQLQYCPFCENGKTDKPYGYFFFNRDKQLYYCRHRKSCGAQGSLYHFKLLRGDINPFTKAKPIVYVKPTPKVEKTKLEKFYLWYEEKRGISKDLVKKYQVTYEKQGKDLIFVYQYFDEKGKLFNRQYKNSTDKKKMWMEKGAELNYYGLQFINFDDDILYVTTGLDDVLAGVQLGLSNIVSVPNGDNSYSIGMDLINNRFKSIILLFDLDDSGQKGAYNFAKKAGLHKCANVTLPYNDLRDCLNEGIDNVHEIIGGATSFESGDISKVSFYRDEYFQNNQKKYGQMTPYKDFNKITKGIRTSEMTVLTGHTGSGKTTFAYNLIMWMVEAGMPCLAMSFENKITSIIRKNIAILSGEVVLKFNDITNRMDRVMSEQEESKYFDTLNNLPFYLLNKEGSEKGYYSLEKMLDVIEYGAKFYGIKFVLIDHLHFFLKLSNATNWVQKMEEAIREITQKALELDIFILVIAHPSKTNDKEGEPVKLGLNSSKGASSLSQESDNFWVVRRGDEDHKLQSELSVLKNREFGTCGSVVFKLKENRNTFYI